MSVTPTQAWSSAVLLLSLALSLSPGSAHAQLAPVYRPVAPADHVSPGDPLVPQARTFTAVRVGDRVLLGYIDNQTGGRGVLHTALLRGSPQTVPQTVPQTDTRGGLNRVRPDAELAPLVRAFALAWDGRHGALVYILPRALPGGAGRAPPPPQRHATPLPPSLADPLGPSSASGGDVVLQRLDANGMPSGTPFPVFTENARLYRVAVALEETDSSTRTTDPSVDGQQPVVAVAWTGATVTDDEIRGTVRALRIDPTGLRHRAASDTNFTGDLGDALRLVRTDDTVPRTVAVFTGARCDTRWGAPPPNDPSTDPSARVENPARRPQPQEAPTEVPGPPIVCEPLCLHAMEFRPDDTFGPRVGTDPIGTDAMAVTPGRAVTSLRGALVGLTLSQRDGFGRVGPWFTAQTPTPLVPLAPPPETEPRVHPPDGWDPVLTENPVLPPTVVPVATAVRTPAALDAAPALLAVVTTDHHTLALLRPTPDGTDATVTPLYVTPALLMEATVLPDPVTPWVLVREGVWGGAVLLLDARGPAVPPPAVPTTVDTAFARLWVRARTARAVFMRYENTAGALAARPEAPTDPRMPGVIATRTRLRGRWESACGQLQSRAQSLVHHGAPSDLLGGVQQLCELHPDLQLGVPVNPAL